MVLIHGLFGSLENLGAIARLLADRFTVYSLDLPNHGRSPQTDSVSLSQMVDALFVWANEQKFEQFYLVGHSLGGKVAMEFALLHPDRVLQLVVMDIAPAHYDPHHTSVFDGLLAIDISSIRSRAEAEEAMKPFVAETAIRSFLLKNLVKAPGGQFSWRMNLQAIHHAYPSLIRANADGKVFPREALFIKGGASDYIKERHRAGILSRFPKTTLKIVANTGHWLHAEKPQIVARLIDKFIT